MTVKQWTLSLAMFLSMPLAVQAEDVFVSAGRQQGQAITRIRGNECFLVSAAHLFDSPDPIDLVDSQRRRHRAQMVRRYGEDLAILKADDSRSSVCQSEHWPDKGSVSSLLSSQSAGVLRSRNEDGSRSQIQVRIVEFDDRFITIEPADGRQILRTWSGGTLSIGSEIVGLIVGVTNRGGRVYRREYVNDLLRSYFTPPVDPRTPIDIEIRLDTWTKYGGGTADLFLNVDGDYVGRLANESGPDSASVSLVPGPHTYVFEEIDLTDPFGRAFPGSGGNCRGYFTVSAEVPSMVIVLMPADKKALEAMQKGRAGKLVCAILDPATADSDVQQRMGALR